MASLVLGYCFEPKIKTYFSPSRTEERFCCKTGKKLPDVTIKGVAQYNYVEDSSGGYLVHNNDEYYIEKYNELPTNLKYNCLYPEYFLSSLVEYLNKEFNKGDEKEKCLSVWVVIKTFVGISFDVDGLSPEEIFSLLKKEESFVIAWGEKFSRFGQEINYHNPKVYTVEDY